MKSYTQDWKESETYLPTTCAVRIVLFIYGRHVFIEIFLLGLMTFHVSIA